MSMNNFANGIKEAMNKRIEKESRAMRGTMKNGRFHSGNKSYPTKQAVECNTNNGYKAWAVKDKNGKAIIVGA